jgi:hypothetical protein
MRSMWQSVLERSLQTFAGFAVALSVGIAADYGIGPAQASVPPLPSVSAVQSQPALSQPALSQPAPPSGPGVDNSQSSDRTDSNRNSGSVVPRQAVGSDPGAGYIRLPGHVLDAVETTAALSSAAISLPPNAASSKQPMTITVVLKRDHAAEFDHYLREVYDPGSKEYRHFLTQAQLSQRFGPSRQAYRQVLGYFHKHGFSLLQGSKNRLTLTLRGSRAHVEKTFALNIKDYQLGSQQFYANDADPSVPAGLASRIESIDGLSDLGKPGRVTDAIQFGEIAVACTLEFLGIGALIGVTGGFGALAGAGLATLLAASCTYLLSNFALNFYNDYNAGNIFSFRGTESIKGFGPVTHESLNRVRTSAVTGAGQTIGLLEFDNFLQSDVSDYLSLVGAPATQLNNLSVVPVNGGTSPGGNQDEVLLDIDTVMSLAPGAKVVVYDAPFSGRAADYASLFNAMINGGVTVISNSWASCEDQVSLADVQGIDTLLKAAAASGISVFNGTGDNGSSCLDGSANTISVPADSPSATAVGGSSATPGPGLTYGSEIWWNGTNNSPPSGQGGYGVSKYFSLPSFQAGFTSAAGRSVPDVVANADPAHGVLICQAGNGGCPTGSELGGTSLAAPEWAAFAARLNERQGKNLGALNPLIYPLGNGPSFHNAASMGTDFAHVGLGSPNLSMLNLSLAGQSVGTPDPTASRVVNPGVVAFGATAVATAAPADGNAVEYIDVVLLDTNGNPVSGKTVTLHASAGSATISLASAVTSVSNGTAVFTVTDLAAEAITFTATDTTDTITLTQTAGITFAVPSAASAGITANPPTVPADGQTAATITVTLKDSLNRPTPGKTVTVSDAGAHAVISGPTSGVTDANGQIQFSATDQVNEAVTFTAIDVTDNSLPIPGSGAVTYGGSTSTACGVGVAPVAGSGYTITPYVTGLPATATYFYEGVNFACLGADNPAFLSSGLVLAADSLTGGVYETGLSGGAVSTTDLLTTVAPTLGNLTFGKDGSLYATQGGSGASIVQLNPATGVVVRTVASGLTCPAGLSVDPLSGDLFFDDECTGGGLDNASIFRVIDPANTDAGNPTSVVVYATLPNTANGGMAFAPNGTLYAVSGYYGNINAPVEQISATNAATVTVTPVTGITSDFAVAIGVANADGSAQSLLVEPAGSLSEVPIATPSAAVVLATGSPGVGVTGPDGCLYSEHYDTVYRLAPSSGNCTFAPTSPAASIKLSPATVAPNPVQGGTQSFTATLHNVSPLSGVPVFFAVTGANWKVQLVNTDANGNAALSYTGTLSGTDTVTATSSVNGTALSSNSVKVTWIAGKHVSFLTLNLSPQGGTAGHAVTVIASLSDLSASPTASIPGQSVTLALGGSTCTATTNSSGNASCQVTPSQAGVSTLTASFAGSSTFVAATKAIGFRVSAGAAPVPGVTIALSPTTVAAGASATLTWSSTNASACTASGAWSGTQATSGTQNVTAAAMGSYTYTLTCSGNGGSAAASATLTANLVAITVTAKSGGGAFGWSLSLLLGLLVLLRMQGLRQGGSWRARRLHGILAVGLAVAIGGVHSVHADQTTGTTATGTIDPPAGDSPTWFEPFYVGARAGAMPTRLSAGRINNGLAADGYGQSRASIDNSATGYGAYVFPLHTFFLAKASLMPR